MKKLYMFLMVATAITFMSCGEQESEYKHIDCSCHAVVANYITQHTSVTNEIRVRDTSASQECELSFEYLISSGLDTTGIGYIDSTFTGAVVIECLEL
jgi:hypothetical protein